MGEASDGTMKMRFYSGLRDNITKYKQQTGATCVPSGQ